MSIEHPKLVLDSNPELSLERLFAEEAFRLLGECAVPLYTRFDGYQIVCPATPPIAIQSLSGEIALRLAVVPTMCAAGDSGSERPTLEPSSKYLVIGVEHGNLDEVADEHGMAYSDTWAWNGYVLTIINTEESGDISVVDVRNGEDLSQADLAQALLTLQAMSTEARAGLFEDEIETTEMHPGFINEVLGPANTFRNFELADGTTCQVCDTDVTGYGSSGLAKLN